MPRANQYQWQAPGNGRLFDTSLEEWETSLMSQRCIGVLNYIDENPLVEKEIFEEEIAEYLQFNYGHNPNDSNKGHFFRIRNSPYRSQEKQKYLPCSPAD